MAKANYIFLMERLEGGTWDSVYEVVAIGPDEETVREMVLEKFDYDPTRWPTWESGVGAKKVGIAFPGEEPRILTYYQTHG